MSVNMQVSLGGLLMKNPVTTASGTFASGKEYAQFFDVSRLGAITTKGLSLNGWAGNDTPRIAETPSGMLNSIGLQNPGVAAFVEKDLPWLREVDTQVIVNVSGHSVAEYQGVVEALETHEGVDAYEIAHQYASGHGDRSLQAQAHPCAWGRRAFWPCGQACCAAHGMGSVQGT